MIGMGVFKGDGAVSELLNKVVGLLAKRITGGRGINVRRSGNNLLIEAQPGQTSGNTTQKPPYWVSYSDE